MAAGTNTGSPSKLGIPVGTRVSCTTYNGEKIEGEVLAFDIPQKIIVLILEESKKAPGQLPALDMNKIHLRIETNLVSRQKATERIGVGVTPQAQKLFDSFCKTFNNCHWDSTKIKIMDVQVTVSPPYSPNDCTGEPKAIDHIKKLIEKFRADQGPPP